MDVRKPLTVVLLPLLAACGVGGSSSAPVPGNLDWAVRVGGAGTTTAGGAVAHFDGGCTVFGDFDAPITLARGSPEETVLYPGADTSVFLARYGASGILLWSQRIFGTSHVTGWDIAGLLDGAVVLSGFYGGDSTFGEDTAEQTTITAPGVEAGFVAVYEPNGRLRFVRRITGPSGITEALGVAAVPDGGFAVTGLFQVEVTVGEGDDLETTLFAAGELGAFVARFRHNGLVVWARAIDSPDGYATGWAVTATGFSGLVVAGEWQGTVGIGDGDAGETSIPSLGSEDLWLARYDLDGTFVWARAVQGADEDEVHALSGDRDGNVRLVGYFRGATNVGGSVPVPLTSAGATDGFLAAYDVAGALDFAVRFGGVEEDVANGVRLFPDGGAVVTGTVTGEASLSSADGGQTLVGSPLDPSTSVLVARWGPLGDVEWARTAGGPADDLAVSIDHRADDSHFFVAGGFAATAVFGAGEPNEMTLAATGEMDAFLARFSN